MDSRNIYIYVLSILAHVIKVWSIVSTVLRSILIPVFPVGTLYYTSR